MEIYQQNTKDTNHFLKVRSYTITNHNSSGSSAIPQYASEHRETTQ